MKTLNQFFSLIKSHISIFLLLICLSSASILDAQVTKSISSKMTPPPTNKTVNCTAGGQLSALLSPTEKTNVEDLTITGFIDARDFKTMRDVMPALRNLYLTGSSIAAYSGTDGTMNPSSYTYYANSIPPCAFFNPNTSVGKISLRTVSLPSSVTTISESAFRNCTGITSFSFTLPSSITAIESFAFYFCGNLATITVPASVTSIGNFAFEGFNGPINVNSSNTIYSSDNGVLFDFDKSKLIQCPTSKTGTYTIPSTVDTIGWYAFILCNKLTGNLEIPASVKFIGEWAFRECTGITGPLVIPASVTSIGNGAFYLMSNLTSIHVYNPVPVDLTTKTDVFWGISKTNCRLYVLYGTVGLYNSADKWTDFENIYGVYKYLPKNDDNITGTFCLPAFDSIIFASTLPVTLLIGSTVNATAGKLIRFLPGFHAQSGCYLHAYINSNGIFCDVISGGSPIVASPTEKSISEKVTPDMNSSIEKSIKVYPNPNNGQFTLEFSNLEVKAEVKVYNALGVTIYKSVIWQKQQKIDLAGIRRGLYFVKVMDGKEQFISKFMVN